MIINLQRKLEQNGVKCCYAAGFEFECYIMSVGLDAEAHVMGRWLQLLTLMTVFKL